MTRRNTWASMVLKLYPAMRWGLVAVIIPPDKLNEKRKKLYYCMFLLMDMNRNIGSGQRVLLAKYYGFWLPNFTLQCFMQKLQLYIITR